MFVPVLFVADRDPAGARVARVEAAPPLCCMQAHVVGQRQTIWTDDLDELSGRML